MYVVFEREAREFQLLFSHFHVSITSQEYHSHCSLMPQRNHSKGNARMRMRLWWKLNSRFALEHIRYVAHFSKFVRPDSVRVDASLEGNPKWQSDPSMPEGTTGIELLAFESHDKKNTVLQILNHWNVSTTILLRYLDLETSLDLPAISITTAIWKS